jgi:hypothetical protein
VASGDASKDTIRNYRKKRLLRGRGDLTPRQCRDSMKPVELRSIWTERVRAPSRTATRDAPPAPWVTVCVSDCR